ncbi:acetylaminoadipate kinase [miscellaneous Crenarchaeota group archaeon SMTZ-80]|nr:MAG: acetylaminoadipate kinase [miscellaneous Crenarchaeota group archaeon SMTZ-80]
MLIVIKIGGSTLEKGLPKGFIADIVEIFSNNKVVIVHGGGKEVTRIASKLGKEQKFIMSPEGFRSRYTDRETVEIFSMVMVGKINKEIVLNLQKNGLNAIGLSGLDASLVNAKRKERLIIIDERGRKRAIAGGFTGKISSVKDEVINLLLQNDFLPVISPVAISEKFEILNVDGDRMAAHIAGNLKADMLILLTDVEGLELDGKIIKRISPIEAKDLLKKVGPGMITKIYAAIEAINLGTKEVVISSGLIEHPVLSPLKYKAGTVVRI